VAREGDDEQPAPTGRGANPLDALVLPTRRPVIPFGPQSVADLLDQPLAERPDAIALSTPSGRRTYREVDAATNRAAHALLELGVRQGDRVGASLPNDVDLVAAFLGAMRVGAVWVGVPRAFSAPEKQELAADCGLSLLLTLPELAVDGVRTIAVDPNDAGAAWTVLTAAAPTTRPDVEVDPFAPAAISYTSGTTGRPKGVVHSQHNMLMPGAVTIATGAYTSDDVLGTVLPVTTLNLMVLNVVIAFQAGSRAALGEVRGDPAAIAAWIEAEEVAVLSLVPTVFRAFVDDPAITPEMLRSATKPRSGGTAVSEALCDAYLRRFGVRLCTSYGATEIMTFATREDPTDVHVAGSTGRALPSIHVAVVDDDGHELPAGESGEIVIGPSDAGPWAGTYVPMLGYWNAPEATHAVLRDGVLHTGDIGRFDDDGHLYVVDRKKSLIIRNGSNIYPAEIERVLALDPRVAGSALVARPDPRVGEATVAFVELVRGASASVDELQDLCGQRLARYKVPDEIRLVDVLPRNTLGKVDRRPLVEAARVPPRESA
jgi:acyl-CoA synthetase (AMP-forming)/AMP-acid ligase II